jgi:hypothetical protein
MMLRRPNKSHATADSSPAAFITPARTGSRRGQASKTFDHDPAAAARNYYYEKNGNGSHHTGT